jgi:hypothetical protein
VEVAQTQAAVQPTAISNHGLYRSAVAGLKVFWFFSSEKNMLFYFWSRQEATLPTAVD